MTKRFADWDYDGDYMFVRFDESFDQSFVGLDGRVYGGFSSGDVARIPVAQAKILVQDTRCTRP